MTDKECVEFGRLLERELMIVWYDGRYRDGSPRWGAKEIAFVQGDAHFSDPMEMSGSEMFGTSPLAAARACVKKRPPRPKK